MTYASSVLGLLRFAERESRPHPGFVVLDSPLVVYRAPDPDESLPTEVKAAFFRGTAAQFKERQVLVLENEDPPTDLGGVNVIRFTKSVDGRYGFFPAHNGATSE